MKHVFITGCPRSGTTMLASMIGNEASSVVTPESDFFIDFVYKFLQNKSQKSNILEYLNFLKSNYRFKQWYIDENNINHSSESINFSDYKILIENTVHLYVKEHLNTLSHELTRVDHTPSSILNFEILNELFPKSKFIFIVRDPRAIYASVKKLDWGANTALRLAEIWNEYTIHYYSVKKRFPERIHLIKYEDILLNPVSSIKELCQFTNLTYHDSMIEGKGFKIPNYTASQHDLVGKKLDKSRIEKWKKELSQKDVLIIESKSKTIMQAFGYKIDESVNYRITFKDKS